MTPTRLLASHQFTYTREPIWLFALHTHMRGSLLWLQKKHRLEVHGAVHHDLSLRKRVKLSSLVKKEHCIGFIDLKEVQDRICEHHLPRPSLLVCVLSDLMDNI